MFKLSNLMDFESSPCCLLDINHVFHIHMQVLSIICQPCRERHYDFELLLLQKTKYFAFIVSNKQICAFVIFLTNLWMHF